MQKYKLEFNGWDENPSNPDIKEMALFQVSDGPIKFLVGIKMVRTLHDVLTVLQEKGTRFSEPQLRKVMLTLALPRLKARLNHLDDPTTAEGQKSLMETFTSEHLGLFTRETRTQCQFQERTTVGLICRATTQRDAFQGKTTSAICASCDLPMDALRCTNLQHPEVIGETSGTGVIRKVASAFCDAKSTLFGWRDCIPDGNNCWRQEVNNAEEKVHIMEDIAERTIDELHYLNLGFRQAFGHALLRINDPRSVTGIVTPCHTQEEFTTKVACLADLFNNFDLSNFDKEIKADIKGPLNRLGEFLRRHKVLLDERPIRTLKHIISIRNSFPIHSGKTEFLAACQELQLEYPPTAWEEAWAIVLHNVWRSLRSLRMALPSNP